MCEVRSSVWFLPFTKKILWDLNIRHAYMFQSTL